MKVTGKLISLFFAENIDFLTPELTISAITEKDFVSLQNVLIVGRLELCPNMHTFIDDEGAQAHHVNLSVITQEVSMRRIKS